MDKLADIAHDVADTRVAIARVEEKINRILDDYKLIEEIESRLEAVERESARAKAWGSGAVAAVIAMAGAVAWIAARVPLDLFMGGR